MNFETTIIPGSIDVRIDLKVKLKAMVIEDPPAPDHAGDPDGILVIHAAARHERWGDDFELRSEARVPMAVIRDATQKEGEENATPAQIAEMVVELLREAITADAIDYIREAAPPWHSQVGHEVELPR